MGFPVPSFAMMQRMWSAMRVVIKGRWPLGGVYTPWGHRWWEIARRGQQQAVLLNCEGSGFAAVGGINTRRVRLERRSFAGGV